MPYKSLEAQRAYQNRWMKQRRLDWLKANGPCVDCASWNDLEVDHVDATRKVSHRIWSWASERRLKELDKCVPRCHDCHVQKTVLEHERPRGEKNGQSKLTRNLVVLIRERVYNGETMRSVARDIGVSESTVRGIISGKWWNHVGKTANGDAAPLEMG